MSDLHRLRTKLCRELAQSEESARVHPTREARRLGDSPPAVALLALAEHSEALRPRFEAIVRAEQPVGLGLGELVGQVFSAVRQVIADRVIDMERSYRGTLLGVRHGLDTARLLREVAAREGHGELVAFCDDLIPQRERLLEQAQRSLAWFADQPAVALRSGLRAALDTGA